MPVSFAQTTGKAYMDVLLPLAVFPAAALLFYIYRRDPVEKEPGNLLARLLIFGVLSTIPAMVLESLGTATVLEGFIPNSTIYLLVENFLIVALVEEACKFFFCRWCTWKNPSFNYVFDGIVYAVFVSLGFAIAENILYVLQYGLGTALVRAFTAIPGHCVFAVFMGYFYGQAKLAQSTGNKGLELTSIACALVIPIFCHGVYDFLASIDGEFTLLMFFAFLIVMVAIGFKLVKRESTLARRIV